MERGLFLHRIIFHFIVWDMVYAFNFFFEYGYSASCLWSSNKLTRAKFGTGPIDLSYLGLSDEIKAILYSMGEEFQTSLDWEYPSTASPWNNEQKKDFISRAHLAYQRLTAELGPQYKVTFCVDLPE